MSLIWKPKPAFDPGVEAEAAIILRALGHPTRLWITRRAQETGGSLCGDLVTELSLAQSTVSQHLGILRAAGVLEVAEDGPRRWYRVRTDTLARLRAYLEGFNNVS